jgi:hypothetical protein
MLSLGHVSYAVAGDTPQGYLVALGCRQGQSEAAVWDVEDGMIGRSSSRTSDKRELQR